VDFAIAGISGVAKKMIFSHVALHTGLNATVIRQALRLLEILFL
jgi:hypothetical protein